MATDDLTTRAHALLTEAMEIDNEDERRSFIDNACAGDATLRAKMDSLLDAMSASTSFLDTPAIEQAGASDAAMPMQLGKYRILRALGVGGMATVYEAEQEEPKRTVALKVMRHALTHTSAVQRFRFETEILARLRHPSIAQIYEAGASDDGHGVSTPYFAMEFIPDALPITEFAKRGELSIRDRLALFLQVCDAVHHGHQVGVIHRDLKPGNVLVDGEGRPKVIDFGIARSTEREEGQITQHTSAGHVIGTLNYMSPEQHAGDAKALDIRTDVYALGVLL